MDNEQITGTIQVLIQSWGVWVVDFYVLCFTPKRVIFAKTGHLGPWEHILTLGLFYFILYAKTVQEVRTRAEQLVKLSPDDILAANNANFQIPYEHIRRFEIQKPRAIMVGWPIRMTTTTTSYAFGLVNAKPKDLEGNLNLVRSVLSDKLVIT